MYLHCRYVGRVRRLGAFSSVEPMEGSSPKSTSALPTIRELETSAHAMPCFHQPRTNFRFARED